ncbi:hypothetical protein C3B78_00265 [Arthrobacter sp. PGP41]|nr:hypothetical protein C3B78_00265 [Arthrobacter sp. PGP41]
MNTAPRLEHHDAHTRLIVDGKPFLCMGGELHNSSSSDRQYMAEVWEKISGSGANTVIATVAWDQVEPQEGTFDFSVVDGILEDARAAGLRLTLIWFGAFKNASSTYAPTWVRADRTRFPRADRGPEPMETPFSYKGSMPRPTLSVFSDQLFNADRTAYCRFMAHLAEVDQQHTVIMVQVENEVGLLGAGRDRSAAAQAAWESPVPVPLRKALANNADVFDPTVATVLQPVIASEASWAHHFGDGNPVADENFHGLGLRDLRRWTRCRWKGNSGASRFRQCLARAATRAGTSRKLPKRRADREDDSGMADGSASHRFPRPGYLRSELSRSHGPVRVVRKSLVHSRSPVPSRGRLSCCRALRCSGLSGLWP